MPKDEPPEIPPISYPAIRAELHFLGTLCEVLPEPSSISTEAVIQSPAPGVFCSITVISRFPAHNFRIPCARRREHSR